MELSRFVILSFILLSYLTSDIWALNCPCDNGDQCKSGACQAAQNWYGPEHCQLLFDPSVNGDRPWRGCNLANSNCDIVSENTSLDVTFTKGKLSSLGGCCGEEQCDTDMESKLNQIKNTTCGMLSPNETSGTNAGFSCHCDPNDMVTLFDLSVERGVQWLSSAIGGLRVSNASRVYENSTALRRRMSGFCSNNMCNADTIAAAGITIPADSFPVCAHLIRSDNGKPVRGCAFVPRTAQKDTVRRAQSTFPGNPIAGAYDVRVGINASDTYGFIFECRSDMCNERQFYENVISQCMPGIDLPVRAQVAVEPNDGTGSTIHGSATTIPAVETTPILGTVGPDHNQHQPEANVSMAGTVVDVIHNGTEAPGHTMVIPVDTNGTTVDVGHQVKDVTTTIKATVKPAGGSAARQVLNLVCLIPVIVLAVFK